MKILIVDDEFTSRLILQKLLSPYGEVQVCEDGRKAVEVFASALDENAPFDLICMDFMMPVMGGTEALAIIREIEKVRGIPRRMSVKILMTTGLEEGSGELEGIEAISDGIMPKPFSVSTITRKLAALGLS